MENETKTKISLGQTLFYIIQNKERFTDDNDNTLRKAIVTDIQDEFFTINNFKEKFDINTLRDISFVYHKPIKRTIFIFLSSEHYETVNKQKELSNKIKQFVNNPRFSELPLVKLENIINSFITIINS